MMSELDIGEILKYLPHRYPFLLLDRIVEWVPNKRLVALKNVTYNEQFFQGHFPNYPIMPAVLILEAMAQATGFLAMRSMEKLPAADSVYYFVGIDKARFRKPVSPGDQLMIEIEHEKTSRNIWRVRATARVLEKTVAHAQIMGALRDLGT
jgi:3-hydroxyacyl-[acyl-carrier-protein] dehydratase